MDEVAKVETRGIDTLPFLGDADADIYLEPGQSSADVERVFGEAVDVHAEFRSGAWTMIADDVQIDLTADEQTRGLVMSLFDILREEPLVSKARVLVEESDIEVEATTDSDLVATYRALRKACADGPCGDIAMNVTQGDPYGEGDSEQVFTLSDGAGDGYSDGPPVDVDPAVNVFEKIDAPSIASRAKLNPQMVSLTVDPYDEFIEARAEARELAVQQDIQPPHRAPQRSSGNQ